MQKWQIQEFYKCKKDPVYFIENYVKIEHQTRGVIPFDMYPFQKEIVQKFQNERWNITNKSRQTGISTITSAFALWLGLFNKNKKILVLSIKDQDAQIFLEKIKIAFHRLPEWMIDDPITDNAHELKLTTGSVIRSVASSKNAARGQSLSLLIVDECAFVKDIEDIWKAAYPTLSTGGRAILISTPNGLGNFFHGKWQGCQPETPKEDRNEFLPTFVHWTQVDEYRSFPLEETVDLSLQEIIDRAKEGDWYKTMRPQFSDREWAQEYEGDFLGSGLTVVKPEVLREMREKLEDPIIKYDEKLEEFDDAPLWVWKEPDPNKMYIIGGDIASGEGDDYSTAQVLDIETGEQVAEYQAKINILDFADFLVDLAIYYNDAYLVPECTGLGKGTVQKIVYELGYHNIHQTINETTKNAKKQTYGWNTTEQTRPLMVAQIQKYFNSMLFTWRSKRLWNELTTFVWVNNKKAEADNNNNDDLVMAFSMAAHNREHALLFQPVGMKQDYYSADKGEEYANASNVVGGDMLIDPYTLESVDIDDVKKKFDADNEEDVNNWLLS